VRVQLDLRYLAGLENNRVVRFRALPAQPGILVDAKQDAVQLILVKK